MIRALLRILKFLYIFISNPEFVWKELSENNAGEQYSEKTFSRKYFVPMLSLGASILFVRLGFMKSGFDAEVAVKGCVSFFLSYYVGQYIALFIIREFLMEHYLEESVSKADMHLVVMYCMSFSSLVDFGVRCFPSLKFYNFFIIYLIYLVWTSNEFYLKTKNEKNWGFSLLLSLIIYGSPLIITFFFQKMKVF